MYSYLTYHVRRIRARNHRLRLLIASQGWRTLFSRLASALPKTNGQDRRTGIPALPVGSAAGVRVLVVDTTTPQLDRDSGSVRAFNLMRALIELGHSVDFLPDDRREQGIHTERLHAAGIRSLHSAPAYPSVLRDERYDVLIVSRYHLAQSLLPLCKKTSPGTRTIFDTVDLHHLREMREAELRRNPRLARLADRTRALELECVRLADATWVVSPHEVDLLAATCPQSRIVVVPNIHTLEQDPPGFAERRDMLFVGGSQHPPNADAVRWLVREIFPRVVRQLPDLTLHLVGSGLGTVVGDLAQPGVRIHGHVPDLGTLLRSTRIGVAPLRFGAGVKGKVNQYMAAGLAVVSTPCGAEGMHLTDGEDVLLAGDPESFAAAIVRLHEDAAMWTRLASAGRDNVKNHFSFALAKERIAATLDATP